MFHIYIYIVNPRNLLYIYVNKHQIVDLDEANNLNRDIMRLVKSMPRLELGTRITLRKDKTQDIRSLDLSLSPSLPLPLSHPQSRLERACLVALDSSGAAAEAWDLVRGMP